MIKTPTFFLIIALSLVNGSFIVSAQTVHPPVTATLLGQTGEDMVGPRSQNNTFVANCSRAGEWTAGIDREISEG